MTKRIMGIAVALAMAIGFTIPMAAPAAAAAPATVAWYHLDEAASSTSVADSSGNGNAGTVVDATLGVPGVFGTAASFDGTDDYIYVASPYGLPTGSSERTISVWFKWAGSWTLSSSLGGGHDAQEILAYGPNTSDGDRVGICLQNFPSTNTIAVETRNEGVGISWSGDTNWHQVTVVYPATSDGDVDDFQIYLDGVLQTPVTVVGADNPVSTVGSPLAIGALPTGNSEPDGNTYYFNGTIDEVRIWNGALTAAQVAYYYSLANVSIDIKPGSSPNSVNLGDTGLLPVAVLGSATFDVTSINPVTIAIGGVTLATRGSAKAPKLAYSYEDVNGDGYTDLVAFFSIPELVLEGVLTPSTTALSLTASLADGTPIVGTDSVNIVPPS